jgi:hypothetical protein
MIVEVHRTVRHAIARYAFTVRDDNGEIFEQSGFVYRSEEAARRHGNTVVEEHG